MKPSGFLVAAITLASFVVANQPGRAPLAIHLHRRAPSSSHHRVTITDSRATEPTIVPQVVVLVNDGNTAFATTTRHIAIVPQSLTTSPPPGGHAGTTMPTTTVTEVPEPGGLGSSTSALVSWQDHDGGSGESRGLIDSSSEHDDVSPVNENSDREAQDSRHGLSGHGGEPTPPESSWRGDGALNIQNSPDGEILGTSFSNEKDNHESSTSGLPGITYSPYDKHGNCKTDSQIEQDFDALAGLYSLVRIYGIDCDQVRLVYQPAKKIGVRLFVGIFELGPLEHQVSAIASAVGHDWGIVHTVSVGNELVNNGQATPAQLLRARLTAKGLLRAAGFQGPVVTVDTFMAVIQHPELCNWSDYCAINAHTFFDGNILPEHAGAFLLNIVALVRSKLSDSSKRIMVTESGWPWQGTSNIVAVPGLDQQRIALQSIKAAFAGSLEDIIFFTAFNDLWKKPAADTFFAEQYWGIQGAYSGSDVDL